MQFIDFLKLIKRKRGTIFTLIFIAVVLTVGISLLFPFKYQAYSRLLVVQKSVGSDPYTLSKSNEYLGNLFSQIVYSGSFYNMVMDSKYDINKNYFGGDYSHQIKIWDKTVKTKTLADTGIIEIRVYHPNPYQAQQIDLAINDILINHNSNYQGGGSSVKINIIDQPLVSAHPVSPNIPQNIVLAFFGGLLFSLFFIYLFPEDKYDVRLSLNKPRKERMIKELVKEKKEDDSPGRNPKHKIKVNYYPYNPYKNRSESNQATIDTNRDWNYREENRTEKIDRLYNTEEGNRESEGGKNRDQAESSPEEFRPHGSIENIL